MWCESLSSSYCGGGLYFTYWHTDVFSQTVRNWLWLSVIHLTLRNTTAVPIRSVPGCASCKGRCGGSAIRACVVSLTPVLSVCVLLSWSLSQSRTAQYQHCHQMQLWHWPVWWMELFTYFLRFRQTKDTLLSYFCSRTGSTCSQSFVEISWFLKRLKGCWNAFFTTLISHYSDSYLYIVCIQHVHNRYFSDYII